MNTIQIKKFQDNLISTRLYVVINFTKESFRKNIKLTISVDNTNSLFWEKHEIKFRTSSLFLNKGRKETDTMIYCKNQKS